MCSGISITWLHSRNFEAVLEKINQLYALKRQVYKHDGACIGQEVAI